MRKTVEAVTGRSFERFFYDWTERPGHPELSISFKWLGEEKLARVVVEQTQKTAAFHFPLTIQLRSDKGDELGVIQRRVTEKKVTLYYPLAEAPALVSVDPQQTILMELKENKGRDLWQEQLLHGPGPVARISAARHFAESRSRADRELLARALKEETFWGVRREIASALGKSGGDVARDALILGLALEDHKARRGCVEALRNFKGDRAAIDAVGKIVSVGDPSYSVEAEAIETYASLDAPDAVSILVGALSRDSRLEVIRNAALSGLGRLRDPALVPLLSEWTRPERPRHCRPVAIRALSRLTRGAVLDDASVQRIVTALTEALEDTGNRIRSAAVRALSSLPEPGKARSALPTLERLSVTDPSTRLREAAASAIKSIESGKPAQVQVAELRDQLKSALEQSKDLTGRVEKLEALLKRGDDQD